MTAPLKVSAHVAMATTPRLSGDGMDSESLAYPISTKSKLTTSTNRHRNLKASTKAATVAKPQAPKFVPREPVRGAIGPGDMSGSRYSPDRGRNSAELTAGAQMTPSRASSLLPANKSSATVYSSTPKQLIASANLVQYSRSEFSKYPYSSGTGLNASNNITFPSPGINPSRYTTRTQNLDPSLTDNSLKFSQQSAPPALSNNKLVFQSHVPQLGSTETDVVVDLSSTVSKQQLCEKSKDTVVDLNTTPPDEEREVEGTLCDDNDKHQKEIDSLKQQLGDLSQVNTDLKKLLVASVGDDLHWKMDALVRTKTQLATEIGGYTEKLMQDYEELDKLSIQADMWRSKFMATRVLIDQLSKEKEEMTSRWKQAQTALQQLLQERQQLQDNMVETHRYLKFVSDAFDPVFSRKEAQMIPNILELARTNLLLSEAVKEKLLGGAPVVAAALDAGIQNGLSPAEKLAYQVLMSELNTQSGHVPGRLSAQVVSKFGRFHPQVRYEGYTFTCCRNCKGEVQVL